MCLVSSGGVEEEIASPAMFLQVEDFFFGRGARWSSAAVLPLRPRWLLCGATVGGFPLRRVPRDGGSGVDDLVQVVGEGWFGNDGVRWCRPLWPAIGDFPSARGGSRIQGMESRSGGAPPTAPWSTLGSGYSRGLFCNFCSCRDLDVIC